MNRKVLVTVPLFSERCTRAKALLEESGFTVVEYTGDTVMSREEIKAVGADIFGVIAGNDRWDDDVFDACPQLKVISRFGVGTEQIDLDAASRHNVMVCNARGMNSDSVAEGTIMLVLAAMRGLCDLDRTTRLGEWKRTTTHTLRGKVYGLVGFGAIAQAVAERLQSFGLQKIIAYDVFHNEAAAEKYHVTFVEKEELLQTADVISLHIPAIPETINFLGAKEFRMMKPSAVVCNVARGPIINEEALYQALKEHVIAAAATDVFCTEPVPTDCPLLTLDNFTMTPHQCADTYETFDSIGYFGAQIMVDVANGKIPPNWLNRK